MIRLSWGFRVSSTTESYIVTGFVCTYICVTVHIFVLRWLLFRMYSSFNLSSLSYTVSRYPFFRKRVTRCAEGSKQSADDPTGDTPPKVLPSSGSTLPPLYYYYHLRVGGGRGIVSPIILIPFSEEPPLEENSAYSRIVLSPC